jgi:outer membrane protein assembly factor BamA
VRREFRQLESSWYDGNRIKLSRDRVDRLGYFKDVNVDTSEVAGAPDQVDLTVTVTEKPTGNLLVGANYSNAEKLGLTASIKQDNVFGSGNYLGIELNTSKTNRTYVLSAVDPYYTVDGISRAVDVFYRTSRPYNSQGDDLPDQHAGCVGALRRAGSPTSTPCSSASAPRAPHRHLDRHPEQLLPVPRDLRRHQPLAAADAGLGA